MDERLKTALQLVAALFLGAGGSYGVVTAKEVAVYERLTACERDQEALHLYVQIIKQDVDRRLDRLVDYFDARMNRMEDRWYPKGKDGS